jgi:hypothetical protein
MNQRYFAFKLFHESGEVLKPLRVVSGGRQDGIEGYINKDHGETRNVDGKEGCSVCNRRRSVLRWAPLIVKTDRQVVVTRDVSHQRVDTRTLGRVLTRAVTRVVDFKGGCESIIYFLYFAIQTFATAGAQARPSGGTKY